MNTHHASAIAGVAPAQGMDNQVPVNSTAVSNSVPNSASFTKLLLSAQSAQKASSKDANGSQLFTMLSKLLGLSPKQQAQLLKLSAREGGNTKSAGLVHSVQDSSSQKGGRLRAILSLFVKVLKTNGQDAKQLMSDSKLQNSLKKLQDLLNQAVNKGMTAFMFPGMLPDQNKTGKPSSSDSLLSSQQSAQILQNAGSQLNNDTIMQQVQQVLNNLRQQLEQSSGPATDLKQKAAAEPLSKQGISTDSNKLTLLHSNQSDSRNQASDPALSANGQNADPGTGKHSGSLQDRLLKSMQTKSSSNPSTDQGSKSLSLHSNAKVHAANAANSEIAAVGSSHALLTNTLDVSGAAAPNPVQVHQFVHQTTPFIIQKLQVMNAGTGTSTVHIQLVPEHLGQVQIQLTMNQGQLNAHFTAGTVFGKDAISSELAQLQSALQNQGISVHKMEVSLSPAMTPQFAQDQQKQQQQHSNPHQTMKKNNGKISGYEQTQEELLHDLETAESEAISRPSYLNNSFNVTA